MHYSLFLMSNVTMLIVMLVFSPLPGFKPWIFNPLTPLIPYLLECIRTELRDTAES